MVEPAIAAVLALAFLAFAVSALLEQATRRRIRERAETFRRFAPQPLFALPLLVPVVGGAVAAGAEAHLRDDFLALGLDELDALDAAAADVDVDAFRSLLRRGCPPPLALEILL